MNNRSKEDGQFFVSSRRLSSEMSVHLCSTEVYYGRAPVAVPFKWETRPGTPRVRFLDNPAPPLTPPPCFLFNSPKTPNRKVSEPKGGILHAIIHKFTSSSRKNRNSPVSSELSSLFSSSSSSDSMDSITSVYNPKNHRQNRRKSFEDEDEDEFGPPVSTLCFRIRCTATPKPTQPRSAESKNH